MSDLDEISCPVLPGRTLVAAQTFWMRTDIKKIIRTAESRGQKWMTFCSSIYVGTIIFVAAPASRIQWCYQHYKSRKSSLLAKKGEISLY